MWIADNWKDYEIIDCSEGEKLERWGEYILLRPDPQVLWNTPKTNPAWRKLNGHYHRSNKGGGEWEFMKLPKQWTIDYKELTFNLKPFAFKHTGLFPEQAVNWDWFSNIIREANRQVKVLNLFAYTGCATMAASFAGADEVVHVDAAKGMVEWAKENMKLCGLEHNKIRFIVDDVIKFLEREKRRGRTYHGIIMDPPSYGRGPKGEVWRLEDNLAELLNKAFDVLDDDYSFLLINSYTTGVSPSSLKNILSLTFKDALIETGEIGLPIEENKLVLPCGIYGRVTKN